MKLVSHYFFLVKLGSTPASKTQYMTNFVSLFRRIISNYLICSGILCKMSGFRNQAESVQKQRRDERLWNRAPLSLSHTIINNRHRLQIVPLSPNARVTISVSNWPCLSQQYNGPWNNYVCVFVSSLNFSRRHWGISVPRYECVC